MTFVCVYVSSPCLNTMDGCALLNPQALLARVGDTLMQHLLLHTAIFLPLAGGSDNYLQVTGRPIAEVGSSSTHHNPYCLRTASWPCSSELRVAYVSWLLAAAIKHTVASLFSVFLNLCMC